MKILLRKFLLKPILQTVIIIILSIIIGLLVHLCKINHSVDKKLFSDFLTLFAQLSGILLGFLIGFFFFTFQSKETLKMQWFLEYKKTIDELVSKFVNLPDKLYYLSPHLGAVIQRLENVTIDDFPNDYLKDSYSDLEKIVKEENPVNPIFNREILYIVGKTEQYSNKINLTIIGIWTSFALINSIYKQLIILIISIALLFFIATVKSFLHKDVMLTVSIIIGLSTTLGFAELVLYISDFYRNRLSEINSR